MMKILEFISRVLVGSLFIVSGLIKANDPMGFSYKLEEYFSTDVLNLPFLEPLALYLAVFICVVEIVLGVAVLVGSKSKLVSWSLLSMIVFFTFLTFYSAYFDKVTDCGCFGDALKFTPWQSFTKDLILFFFIAVIFIRQKYIQRNLKRDDLVYFSFSLLFIILFSLGVISWTFPIVFSLITFVVIYLIKNYVKSDQNDWILAGAATVISTVFSVYCVMNLPIRDFRPYAVEKNIEDGIKGCDELGLPCPKFGYIYTLRNTDGSEKEMTDNEYLTSGIWEDSSWEIVETSNPITIQEGYEPPVHDFNLIDDETGDDITYSVLSYDRVLLVVSYDLDKTDESNQQALNDIAALAEKAGVPMYGLTASNYEAVNDFRHKNQNMFPFLTADGTMLKTIIRSNPGLVYLEKGTVKGKWHSNDLPVYADIF